MVNKTTYSQPRDAGILVWKSVPNVNDAPSSHSGIVSIASSKEYQRFRIKKVI